jgi:hypothetical protein
VILDRDPRADIDATRATWAVMADGRYLGRAELDELLRKIAAAAETL